MFKKFCRNGSNVATHLKNNSATYIQRTLNNGLLFIQTTVASFRFHHNSSKTIKNNSDYCKFLVSSLKKEKNPKSLRYENLPGRSVHETEK